MTGQKINTTVGVWARDIASADTLTAELSITGSGRVRKLTLGSAVARLAHQVRREGVDVLVWYLRPEESEDLHHLPSISQHVKVVLVLEEAESGVIAYAMRYGASSILVRGYDDEIDCHNAVWAAVRGKSHLSEPARAALAELLEGVPIYPRPGMQNPLRGKLSRREQEIMDCMARGMTNEEVATTMFISHKTVKNHINRLFAKLGVRHRGEAMAMWLGVEKQTRCTSVSQPSASSSLANSPLLAGVGACAEAVAHC